MRRRRRVVTIMGLRPSALLDLYRWRLSEHRAQELLAGSGIAIGVALFFGVLAANGSLIGSAGQLMRAVNGHAQLELAARSPEGLPQSLARRVFELPGVDTTAPVLRTNAIIVGPHGRALVQLVGVTPNLLALGGTATRNLGAGQLLLAKGLGLPSGVAEEVGIEGGQTITLASNGSSQRLQVRAVLGSQVIGPVANSPIVIALMGVAQRLAGRPHRITEVLVTAMPGEEPRVKRELVKLAAGEADVEPATTELAVLRATAAPTSQSTSLFAAISGMVGLLLALNATLLTVPGRRRFAAQLREQGYSPGQVRLVLLSQALMLGLAGSFVGVALGGVLLHSLFSNAPSYLRFAFPIGTKPVVPLSTVTLAVTCGVIAAVLASLLPMSDLLADRAPDAVLRESGEPGEGIGHGARWLGAAAFALLATVTVLVLLDARLSIVGGVLLAVAAFCVIGPLYTLVRATLRPVSERMSGSMLALAMVELDATATRSVALAGVAALAVYGMVAIQGARSDLVEGLNAAVVDYLDTAQVWVTANNDFLTVDGFQANGLSAAIAREPGVASVREYQGQMLDIGTRRLWLRARPADDRALVQPSQLLYGDLTQATRLIRRGGWVAISDSLAEERHTHVGGHVTLPTPSGPVHFGVAAITTNVGWPPGAITLNDADYRRYWHAVEPTALEVSLKPGIAPLVGRREVQAAIGPNTGLLVQTYGERKARYEESLRQGIQSLTEIATLLLIAASLALTAALSAAIWQRRARLASLKAQGFDGRQLWRALLLESGLLLAIGSLDGAILGVYGHVLASRWLELSVGFPAPFSLGIGLVLLTLGLMLSIALLVIALPGLLATRVSTQLAFQE